MILPIVAALAGVLAAQMPARGSARIDRSKRWRASSDAVPFRSDIYRWHNGRMNALQLVAEQVGVSERTLRRAVGEGALHAVRPTPRTLAMSVSERDYVRRKWPLLSALRARLRTEPNVRLAVLFGSTATDRDTADSDVDLLVQLRDSSFERLLDLGAKLETAVGRHVDLVELRDTETDPAFLARIVSEGRALVDRDRRWPRLRGSEQRLIRRGSRREAARLRSALAGIDRLLASS